MTGMQPFSTNGPQLEAFDPALPWLVGGGRVTVRPSNLRR
jgi:hypothetical protein